MELEKIKLVDKGEIVSHLNKSVSSASADCKTLHKWETKQITTREAISQIIYNNRMDRVSDIEQYAFYEFAQSLGYLRGF